MAFGADLKDFVSAFSTGYNLIKSPAEKEREAAAEKRAQGSYEREGKWHDQSYAREGEWHEQGEGWKQKNFDRDVARDKRSDFEWDETQKFNERKNNRDIFEDERDAERQKTQDEHQRNKDALDQAHREALLAEAQEIRRQEKARNDLIKKGVTTPEQQTEIDGLTKSIEDRKIRLNKMQKDGRPVSAGDDDLSGSRGNDTLNTTDGALQPTAIPEDDGQQQSRYNRDNQPTRPKEIAHQLVIDLQKDFGMPEDIAIGIVGQLAHESIGFTTMQEKQPMIPGSKGGWGYSQWTGPRRRQFEAFTEAKGLDPSSYEANYRFLRYELANTSEGKVLKDLRGARDARHAGRIFTNSFLRPGIPGYKSRDNWTDRVGSLFSARGGLIEPVRNYASGGFVDDFAKSFNSTLDKWEYKDHVIKDDEDDEDEPAKTTKNAGSESTNWYADGGAVTAIPEEEDELLMADAGDDTLDGGTDVPPVEEPTAIPPEEVTSQSKEKPVSMDGPAPGEDLWEWGRKAHAAGMKAAAAEINDIPETVVDDPELVKRGQSFAQGYGAADPKLMKQAMDLIDPERQMSQGERLIKAQGAVYQYFMEKGDQAKATEAAKDMMKLQQKEASRFMLMAQAAASEGDMDVATQAAVAAYAQIPNGKDMKITPMPDGNYEVSVTDVKTGKPIKKIVATPDQIIAEAMGFNQATFANEMMAASGTPPEEVKQTDMKPGTEQGTAVADSMDEHYAGMYPDKDADGPDGEVIKANPDAQFMDSAKEKALKAAAKNIMSIEGNNMDAAEALEFLDPTSPERYGVRPVTGTKFVEVRRNGVTKRIHEDQFKKVHNDWKKIQRQGAQNRVDEGVASTKKQFEQAKFDQQSDVAGAAERAGEYIAKPFTTGLGDPNARPTGYEGDKVIPDDQVEVRDVPLAVREEQPVEAAPETATATPTAIPEEEGGWLDQLFTPSKPESDIAKTVSGASVERLTKQHGQLQTVLERMRRSPGEYKQVIPKREAQLRKLEAEISSTLKSEIASLEQAAKSKEPTDTTDYKGEIARRKQALAEHEKSLTAK